MTIKSKMLEAALQYERQGLSVIPVGADKKPLLNWKKYQQERASKEQIELWFSLQFPNANVGIVTGKISKIAVVDIEAGGETKGYPQTVTSQTGGGGVHFFYKHPSTSIKNASRIRELTDIRGDGGYVVAPPSLHKSGNNYEWTTDFQKMKLAEFPSEMFKEKTDDRQEAVFETSQKNSSGKFFESENLKGSRNDTAAKVAGKLLQSLPKELHETAGWAGMKEWNANKNKPPLAEKELQTVWESIKKMAAENPTQENEGQRNQAEQLIEIVENHGIILFHDDDKSNYACLSIDGHKEVLQCNSGKFKQWLGKIFWEEQRKAPNSDSLNNALNVIKGMAQFDGEKIKLANRVAFHDESLWYDLSDENWRAVKITSEGWEVINNPPIIFKRYSHQKTQVNPARSGNVKNLLAFVNVENEGLKLLILIWLISCFIPDFPHPIPIIYGQQGAAKSTLCRLSRQLIDPTELNNLSFPKTPGELAQIFSHHWYLPFDNISSLPEWASDALCKVVTGYGFSKRELYTNDEDVIYKLQRCIAINGINLVATKPDLLDRALLFELQRFPKNKRKTEKKLTESFDKELPKILGGIFDVLSKAMKIYPSINLEGKSRMADFEIWGCAIAEALDYKKEVFLRAYSDNIETQNREVLYENVVAAILLEFMNSRVEWRGTPSDLLAELENSSDEKTIKRKDFPKSANVLSKKINELKTNFAEVGLNITRNDGKQRIIVIQKVPQNIVETVESTKKLESKGCEGDDSSDDRNSGVSASSSVRILKDRTKYDNDGVDDKNPNILESSKKKTIGEMSDDDILSIFPDAEIDSIDEK